MLSTDVGLIVNVETADRTLELKGMLALEIGILHNPTRWFLVYLSMTLLYQYSRCGSFLRSAHVLGGIGLFGNCTANFTTGVIGTSAVDQEIGHSESKNVQLSFILLWLVLVRFVRTTVKVRTPVEQKMFYLLRHSLNGYRFLVMETCNSYLWLIFFLQFRLNRQFSLILIINGRPKSRLFFHVSPSGPRGGMVTS